MAETEEKLPKTKTKDKELGQTSETIIADVKDVNVVEVVVGSVIGFITWYVMSKIIGDDPTPKPTPPPEPSPVVETLVMVTPEPVTECEKKIQALQSFW